MEKRKLAIFSIIFLVMLLVSCGKSFNVDFDLDGGTSETIINTQKVKDGDLLEKPINPTKENHTFLGWIIDGEFWDFENDKVRKDIKLKAFWEINEYIVLFNSLEGVPTPPQQIIAIGEKASKPENPELEGNEFLGWYLGDELFDFNNDITENINLIAKWEKEVYTVTFLFEEEGDILEIQQQTYGNKISLIEEPEREYATFLGWYYEGKKWNFDNPIKSDMVLFAKWNIYYEMYLNDLEEYYKDTLGSFNFRPLEDVLLIDKIKGMEIAWSSSDADYFTNDGEVILPEKGTPAVKIYLKASITPAYYIIFSFEILNYDPEEPPSFTLTEEYEEIITVNFNKTYNPLKGVKVIDAFDGDITNQIVVENVVDTTNYGMHAVALTITNSFGKTNTLTRQIEVIWNYDVTFIGHAGSYYGLMNSEEAVLYAIEVLKYQAVEVDLKQTKDGVFVLSHDDTFGGYTIASTNWSTLKNVTVTASRNAGIPAQNGSVTGSPYTTGLLTLERFLQICKTHNVKAVIELKSSPGITNTNQSRMQAFIDVVEANDMINNIILLGSQYNALIWTRNNGYEFIPCQYLVNSMESQTFLDRCINNNLDISVNISYDNSNQWIAKYKANGLKVAVYTFNQYQDYNVIQSWIDKGVDYVTTDWHIMSNLNLPETDNEPKETFTVTFKDYDGTILKTVITEEGSPAIEPTNMTRLGYTFIGWSESVTAVIKNLTVTAIYEINTYTITYNPNVYGTELASFTNKTAFVNEFYNDFYEWLLDYGKDLNSITVSGNKITINLNGVNKTVNNVSELKAVDIYDFEKTFGTLIYKPFNRLSNDPVVMDESNKYFLNTSPYKLKYEPLDAWFLNAMVNEYTTYDRGYNQASGGRVQIMFRFHQWQQGTSIAQFNTLPKKNIVTDEPDFNYELPTTNKTYTVNDDFNLPLATGEKVFLGWYLDSDCTISITKIQLNSTGNITVYAKWGL